MHTRTPLTPREVERRKEAFKTAIGKETEKRFYDAFHDSNARLPVWFQGIRKVGGLTDSEGIDCYAIVDTGEIPLQIKSSTRWIAEYRRKHPKSEAVILVIKPEMTPETIRILTCKHLSPRRLQKMPRSWRNPDPINKSIRI